MREVVSDRQISLEGLVKVPLKTSMPVKKFCKKLWRYGAATIVLDSSAFIRYEQDLIFLHDELCALEKKEHHIIVPYSVVKEIKIPGLVKPEWHTTIECQEIHKYAPKAREYLSHSRKMQVHDLFMPFIIKFLEGNPYAMSVDETNLLHQKRSFIARVLGDDFKVLLQRNGAAKAYDLLQKFRISETDTAVMAAAISACERGASAVLIGARDWDLQDAVKAAHAEYSMLHYVKAGNGSEVLGKKCT